jgi:Putative DNA-binding domain
LRGNVIGDYRRPRRRCYYQELALLVATRKSFGLALHDPKNPTDVAYACLVVFTPLHRSLGLPPSELTDAILEAAVAAGVMETDDLDWKSELPPVRGILQTDVPKDIAAMANSGGGMIVYGIDEAQESACGRKDTGPFDEGHERALRSAAITAITPSVGVQPRRTQPRHRRRR